jgi:hypothetical protein
VVQVEEVSRQVAAEALARAGITDPRGVNTAADIARHGQCMRLRTAWGEAVMVVRIDGETFWIDAAAGRGVMPLLDALVTSAARHAGCKRVRFETARRGLQRIARMTPGWRVCERIAGAVVLEKET